MRENVLVRDALDSATRRVATVTGAKRRGAPEREARRDGTEARCRRCTRATSLCASPSRSPRRPELSRPGRRQADGARTFAGCDVEADLTPARNDAPRRDGGADDAPRRRPRHHRTRAAGGRLSDRGADGLGRRRAVSRRHGAAPPGSRCRAGCRRRSRRSSPRRSVGHRLRLARAPHRSRPGVASFVTVTFSTPV